jgi:glycerol-3-phosphate acyltransferase PlsY
MSFAAIYIAASFLLGSIPFGHIVARRISGVDIQTLGSGNIGSTNVGRIVGRKAGLLTQLLDIAKGLLPTLAALLIARYGSVSVNEHFPHVVALATICGHNFTPWLNFRGGKGVNTTLGASLVLAPFATLASVAVFFVISRITGHVALGSLAIGVVLPAFCWIEEGYGATVIYAIVAGFLIFVRHKDNIRRLIGGNEDG